MTVEPRAAFEARLVTTSLGPVEVALAGSGPAVVLLHGMPGDWRQTRPIAERLLPDSTVVLLSRPGYGRTTLGVGRSIDAQARLYAAVLDAFAVERATVVGISGGGPSATAFSRLFAERTSGLVLVSAVCPDLLDLPALARRVAVVPGLWESLSVPTRFHERRKLRNGFDELANLTDAEVAWVVGHPELRADLRRYVIERPSVLRGPGLRNDIVQCGLTQRMPKPIWHRPPPAVVIHGDADEVVPAAHAHEHVARIGGARLDLLSGWGHALPLVAADRVAAAIRELALG